MTTRGLHVRGVPVSTFQPRQEHSSSWRERWWALRSLWRLHREERRSRR